VCISHEKELVSEAGTGVREERRKPVATKGSIQVRKEKTDWRTNFQCQGKGGQSRGDRAWEEGGQNETNRRGEQILELMEGRAEKKTLDSCQGTR